MAICHTSTGSGDNFNLQQGITLFHRGVAQLVERRSPKPKVAGSIPVAPAILSTRASSDFAGLLGECFGWHVRRRRLAVGTVIFQAYRIFL